MHIAKNCLIKLYELYRYTIEFGSIKEDGQIKAYGGGIAGSFGECLVINKIRININYLFWIYFCFKNYLSGKPKFQHLNPFRNFTTSYPIQDVQSNYYYNENFEEAINMILKFGKNLRKPMKCYYDDLTKTVKRKKFLNYFYNF